jgi:plastocyanin
MSNPSGRRRRIGGRVRRLALLVVAAAVTAAFVPAGQGAGETLTGTVGPGFTITLTSGGAGVTQLDAGTYTIQVSDKSEFHNFHLTGPGGVSQFTGIEEMGDFTWNVTLVDGVYTYLCDAHPSSMKRTFRVGAAPPAAKPSKLYGNVGPGRTITLGTASGKRTARVAAGKYSVVVRDRSRTESFHLSGPGVNRKTGRAFTGSATWAVTLKAASTYRYWSDAHPALKGTLKTS